MSDLLKVRIGGSDYLCKWEQTYSVKIGGRKYPVVKIGNQLWMAENLDWKWEGLTIGGERINSTRALYYNNDESSYGYNGMKFGLLYNNPAKDYIRDNLLTNSDGWRLPTENDTNALSTFIDDSLNIGYKLSEEVSWGDSSWTGNNQYGFNGIPVGQWNSDRQSFRYHGVQMVFWHSESDYVYERYSPEQTDFNLFISVPSLVGFYSIRLVKDAPGYVTIGGRQYKTVTIGNQEWLAENLDFKPTGVTIGANAWYYDNDEQTYGYRGLLYSWDGVSAIIDSNLLPSGWRVPSKDDFDNLVLAVGSDAAKKLKASSFGGTDDFGFTILNAGYYAGVFGDEGTGFWTISDYSSSAKDAPWFYYNSDSWSWDHITYIGTTNSIPIRLVRTLT